MNNLPFRKGPLVVAVLATLVVPASASLLDEAGDIVILREMENVSYHDFTGFDVAALPDGGFAVIWAETYSRPALNDDSIIMQRFDASGNASGDALTLYQEDYSQGTSRFSQPAVATDADGDLVVAWTTPGNNCFGDLFIQTLDADGDWSDLPAPTEVSGSGCDPRLAMDADGDFALTWRSGGGSAFLRTYSADGTSFQGSNIALPLDLVSTSPTPVLAMQPDGALMVAWESGDDDYVYGQRFNLNGTTLDATPKRLDNGALNNDEHHQHGPALAAYGDDGFIAFWDERQPSLTDGVETVAIKGLRWHGDGTPGKALTGGDTLNTEGSFYYKRTAPALAVDSAGNALVAWQAKVNNQKPEMNLTHLDDRLNIAELKVPFIDPETLFDGSLYRQAPKLIMSDDRAVLVWLQREQETDQPKRLLARTLPTLVEDEVPTDGDTGNNAGDSDSDGGSSGGAGGPLLLGLLTLLGLGRWLRRG